MKELNDDAIFVDLEIALSEKPTPISSLTKAPIAESEAKLVDTLIVKIFIDCYEMIKGKDLQSLGMDQDCIGKLTNKAIGLVPLRSQLSPFLQEAATKLECLYKDLLDQFTSLNQALAQHHSLVESKAKVLEDLYSLKKRKAGSCYFDYQDQN